jgi:hypothetical protein
MSSRLLVCLVLTVLAVASGASPTGAVTLNPGDLVVSSPDSSFGDPLVHVVPGTGVQTSLRVEGFFSGPSDHAIAPNGDLLVLYQFPPPAPAIVRVDPWTGAQTLLSIGGVLNFPTAIASNAAGDVFVLDSTTDPNLPLPLLIEIDLATGDQTPIPLGSGIGFVLGIDVEADGQVLVLGAGPPTAIIRVDPGTGVQTVVAEGGFVGSGFPSGIAVGSSEIFVITGLVSGGGALIGVDPDFGFQRIVALGGFLEMPGPQSELAFGPGGEVFGLSLSGGVSTILFAVDPATGQQRLVSEGGVLSGAFMLHIATDPLVDVFVTDASGFVEEISRIDPTSGAQTVIATRHETISAARITIDEVAGDVFVYDTSPTTPGMVRVGADTATLESVSTGGFLGGSMGEGVTLATDGTLFVASAFIPPFFIDPGVIRVDPQNGAQSVLTSGGFLIFPQGIATGLGGDLFVVDQGPTPRVVRVNSTTGGQQLFASAGLLNMPMDIAAGASGDLFVLDSAAPPDPPDARIVRIDGTTGGQSAIDPPPGSIGFARRLAVGCNEAIFVLDEFAMPPAIIQVDPTTGASTLITDGGLLSGILSDIAAVPCLVDCDALGGDADGDGVCGNTDNCPTIPNGPAEDNQADGDFDTVGDACDNCVAVANPAASYPASRTTTGGQLDDDADGHGNSCDGKFTSGSIVTALDTIQYKGAINKPVDASNCGSPATMPCDQFDLDGASPVVTALDTIRFKAMLNLPVGPKCADCGVDFVALPCVGDACP